MNAIHDNYTLYQYRVLEILSERKEISKHELFDTLTSLGQNINVYQNEALSFMINKGFLIQSDELIITQNFSLTSSSYYKSEVLPNLDFNDVNYKERFFIRSNYGVIDEQLMRIQYQIIDSLNGNLAIRNKILWMNKNT